MIELWVIRHKPTGGFLPEPKYSKRGRGGALYEPSTTDKPRLFRTERGAKNALTAWLQGKWHWTLTSWEDGEGSLDIKPVPSRLREEMEIVHLIAVESE